MRLAVDADEGEMDSYISFDDGNSFSLHVPSGNTTGLKLNHSFTIPAGGVANFNIDFDLRKSVHKQGSSSDDYKLRPTLRITDNIQVGAISGYITEALVEDGSCQEGLAVYGYSGADVMPDDEGSSNPPLTSATLVLDSVNQQYNYQLSYLTAGDYTIAITCDADSDDPEIDESSLLWATNAEKNIAVQSGTTSDLNFE